MNRLPSRRFTLMPSLISSEDYIIPKCKNAAEKIRLGNHAAASLEMSIEI